MARPSACPTPARAAPQPVVTMQAWRAARVRLSQEGGAGDRPGPGRAPAWPPAPPRPLPASLQPLPGWGVLAGPWEGLGGAVLTYLAGNCSYAGQGRPLGEQGTARVRPGLPLPHPSPRPAGRLGRALPGQCPPLPRPMGTLPLLSLLALQASVPPPRPEKTKPSGVQVWGCPRCPLPPCLAHPCGPWQTQPHFPPWCRQPIPRPVCGGSQ